MPLPSKRINNVDQVDTFSKEQEVIFSKSVLVSGIVRLTMKWGKKAATGYGLKKKLAEPVDLDLSLFACNANYECPDYDCINFFNHLVCLNGAIKHSPDARDGGGEEYIDIDFARLPSKISVLVATVTIFEGDDHLGMVDDAEIIVSYGNGGKSNCPLYDNPVLTNHKGAAFVVFEKRENDEWALTVSPSLVEIGTNKNAEKLEHFCLYFGLEPKEIKRLYGC
ncbi:MAG: TerD family protein [Clostridia bacterium]|nr:TerD family protein [Clostridia bacterium]